MYMFSYLCYKCSNEKKKRNVVFLTLNYVEKIRNDYGFHSFIKHVLRKYEMIMVSIVL